MEILIVEDEFISRNLLKKMLIEMGHEVIEAENGVQAWEILKESSIKIVISDWMMPEMDGLKLCHQIRNSELKGYVYVIMLTAKDRKDDLVDVFNAGADDYIPKPFDPEELRARVMTGVRVVDLEEQHTNLAQTLIESRNKLRIVLDSLKEEIVSLDKDLRIVSVNQSYLQHVEIDADSIVGKHFFRDKGLGQRFNNNPKIQDIVNSVFENKENESELLIVKDSQGEESYCQFSCLPIFDKNGQVFQISLVFQDVTEERKRTAEITSLNEQLIEQSSQIEAKKNKLESTLKRLEDTQTQMLQSEKMASIGQLAAGVAHEINNPTGFVSSNLKTLSDYQKDIAELIDKYHGLISSLENKNGDAGISATVKEDINKLKDFEEDIDVEFLLEDIVDLIGDCREGTDRIKKIVIDLKDFAHPGEEKEKTVDINKGLESTLNVVNNEIKYKATVHKDLGTIPTVKGIAQQLNQVFMNILVNAAQAIEKKGEIHVKTKTVDDNVEIRIADSGSGISQENIAKIFDPFFTTKDVGKGTGLGMNIAYNIIQKHNGNIDVESEVGKGTTFIITLPGEKVE